MSTDEGRLGTAERADNPLVRTPRLTEREWDAILSALTFVLAGENPWPDEAGLFEASETAAAKVAVRLAALRRNRAG